MIFPIGTGGRMSVPCAACGIGSFHSTEMFCCRYFVRSVKCFLMKAMVCCMNVGVVGVSC